MQIEQLWGIENLLTHFCRMLYFTLKPDRFRLMKYGKIPLEECLT